jgi:ADP-dependent phosphofructokinase/glucokinase
MTDRREEYARAAEAAVAAARGAAPALTGFSACVDRIHPIGTAGLDALAAAGGRHDPMTGKLAAEVLDRIALGRGGEIYVPAPRIEPELRELLGDPACLQVGGTGVQASWALAVLGAPSVAAVADRSADQLAVLHPDVGLCAGGAVVPAGRMTGTAPPAKPPHYILEFTAGTRWSGGVVPRSSRIIVRLAEDGIERDAEFAALTPALAARAGAGLVSGFNGIPTGDTASRKWLHDVVSAWRDADVPTIHLELAEFVSADALPRVMAEYAGLVDSAGMSLSELSAFGVAGRRPAELACRIAVRFGLRRIRVHADDWAFSVHRGDPEAEAGAVRLGNLLAAARARHGEPTADLCPGGAASFATDIPPSGPLGDGWRVECLPAPYLRRPATTVGLGDTFVAGLLLAAGTARTGG